MNQMTYREMKEDVLQSMAGHLTESEYRMLATGSLKGMAIFFDEDPAAFLLYSRVDEEVLQMEWIYVEEDYRRQGLATELLQVFCEEKVQGKYDFVISFEAKEETDDFYRFLNSQNEFYIEKEEGFEALISAEEVAAICKRFVPGKAEPKRFFEQSKMAQGAFIAELKESYPMIAWEMQNNRKAFCEDLCGCAVDKEGIQAVCMMKGNEEEYELSFLYAHAGKGVLAAKALSETMQALMQRKTAPIRLSAVNETSVKLLKGLSKNYEITKQQYTAYYIGR